MATEQRVNRQISVRLTVLVSVCAVLSVTCRPRLMFLILQHEPSPARLHLTLTTESSVIRHFFFSGPGLRQEGSIFSLSCFLI